MLASLTGSLRSIDAELTTPDTRPAFHDWVRRLLGPSAAALGWNNARAASSDNDRTLRAALLRQLGEAGDPGAVETARRLVDQELATPKSADPTLLEVAVNVAAANGDAACTRSTRRVPAPPWTPRIATGSSTASPASATRPLVRRTMEYALGPGGANAGHQARDLEAARQPRGARPRLGPAPRALGRRAEEDRRVRRQHGHRRRPVVVLRHPACRRDQGVLRAHPGAGRGAHAAQALERTPLRTRRGAAQAPPPAGVGATANAQRAHTGGCRAQDRGCPHHG